jgi:hypothetical protein
MKEPKFKINDTVECDAIVGWVKDVFRSTINPDRIAYEIEEPESEALLLYAEEDLL